MYRESLVENVSKDLTKKRILEEPDYIKCPKLWNSLSKYTNNNEITPDAIIARLLMISVEDVEKIYNEAIDILKESLVESDEEE